MSYSTTSPSDLSSFLVADMDWITPDLAVGGDLLHDPIEAAAQARWLERQGVTDIIDCRGEYSDEDLVADVCPGIRYHHLPTGDHGGELDPEWWETGVAIGQVVADRGGSVFVHCHMGVNRGPSLALAILFDRGMDPLAAFDLLRARRPQAFAIYAPQFLRLDGRREDAKVLEAFMELETPHEELVAAIGRIRKAESGGCYRFPLRGEQPEWVPDSDTAVTDDVDSRVGTASDSTFGELVELMTEFKGFESTEWPLDWVRSLVRHLEAEQRTHQVELPAGMCLTELHMVMDDFMEKRGW